MDRLKYLLVFSVIFFAISLEAVTTGEKDLNLVKNADFKLLDANQQPRDWQQWQPVLKQARCRIRVDKSGLIMDAPDRPYAVGGVQQEIKGIQGGLSYRIKVDCQWQALPDCYRSLLVRIIWRRGDRVLHPAGMLIRGPLIRGAAAMFDDVLPAPTEADNAILSLTLKWPQGGAATWTHASIRQVPPIPPRKVKVGTVYLRPRNSTPEKNLQLFCRQIDKAGKLHLDIICLGEVITRIGTSASLSDVAEPIPGRATAILGEAARRNNLWVVAGLTEKAGKAIYGTAVLLDRQGRLAGTYRKVHLPREEWTDGITPGSSYPVFQTDFGKIAIQICYDWFFPEPEEIFALKGAEIIFAPTWGNTWPDKDGMINGETVFRVRARDNGVFMVPCVYDGNSMVIDPMGRILTSSKGKEGLYWAEIDLNVREPLQWIGYWRSIGPRHRRPDTYQLLVR